VKAVKRLVNSCVKQAQAAQATTRGHLPLIELRRDSYLHPQKERGRIWYPIFEVMDWVPTVSIDGALRGHQGFEAINQDLGEEPVEEEPAKVAVKPARKTASAGARF
jgi:hypothetical protein